MAGSIIGLALLPALWSRAQNVAAGGGRPRLKVEEEVFMLARPAPRAQFRGSGVVGSRIMGSRSRMNDTRDRWGKAWWLQNTKATRVKLSCAGGGVTGAGDESCGA